MQHLLGYVETHPPSSLDELVFLLGDDTEHAIGALLTQHGIEPILSMAGQSHGAARDAAVAANEGAGRRTIVGIRPEVIDEMVELIARAGARQYFMADTGNRGPILHRLSAKARLRLTGHEINYLLDL